ncbi:LysM domain-containing protein [Caulobacter sp. UNC279MFTsu5.1]|uniref:LysM peptidoglycan-binding domain-containing protein n=1 Tax=Caulobacter sp. UNC279MFTsu5.1 TaxID=1502775 RepID=UPI0008DF40F3|nr:LysM peptidoglycan-binding domain-containing protein [Caulobacter sp. UNC279MFTsu5.1]SFJ67890.1 LysM domain-containing protein [Caulobacter sp. UNC279MFTsu5.1]
MTSVSLNTQASVAGGGRSGSPPDEHLVKPGETLSGIAAEHGVSLDALIRANPQIVNPNLIRPGQAVTLPTAGGEPRTYRVVEGDNLSKIGETFGVSWRTLAQVNHLANPNLIHVGQALLIPGGGTASVRTETATTASAQTQIQTTGVTSSTTDQLGALSERYETGGRGPGTVSSGAGDPGGVSYGTYQLAGNLGRPQQFLANEGRAWAAEFGGASPGSASFTAAWKAIAAREPERFEAAQHAYIQRTHYDVQVAHVQAATGLDLSTRSAALKDVAWSTSVQHGPETNAIVRAMARVEAQGVEPTDGQAYDRALINAIYDERGKRDASGALAYFTSASAQVQASVAARFGDERRDALAMLDR